MNSHYNLFWKLKDHLDDYDIIYRSVGIAVAVMSPLLFVMIIDSYAIPEQVVVVGKTILSSTEKCIVEYQDGYREITFDSGCKYEIGTKVLVKSVMGEVEIVEP